MPQWAPPAFLAGPARLAGSETSLKGDLNREILRYWGTRTMMPRIVRIVLKERSPEALHPMPRKGTCRFQDGAGALGRFGSPCEAKKSGARWTCTTCPQRGTIGLADRASALGWFRLLIHNSRLRWKNLPEGQADAKTCAGTGRDGMHPVLLHGGRHVEQVACVQGKRTPHAMIGLAAKNQIPRAPE